MTRRAKDRDRRWRGIGVTVVTLALAGWLLAVTGSPNLHHSSVLNAVFDTRWMIAVSRLVILVAGGYLIVSAGVRIARGQWAKSAGGLSADIQDVTDEREVLRQQLSDASDRIVELEALVTESTEVLAHPDILDTEDGSDPDEGR